MIQKVSIAACRILGTLAVGGVFLWHVAASAGPQGCEAVIHVTEPDVVVRVDGIFYPIDPAPGAPIVCALRPGCHTLTLHRGGRELYREAFAVEPGGQVVLTARDESRRSSSPAPPRCPPPATWVGPESGGRQGPAGMRCSHGPAGP